MEQHPLHENSRKKRREEVDEWRQSSSSTPFIPATDDYSHIDNIQPTFMAEQGQQQPGYSGSGIFPPAPSLPVLFSIVSDANELSEDTQAVDIVLMEQGRRQQPGYSQSELFRLTPSSGHSPAPIGIDSGNSGPEINPAVGSGLQQDAPVLKCQNPKCRNPKCRGRKCQNPKCSSGRCGSNRHRVSATNDHEEWQLHIGQEVYLCNNCKGKC